uniref:CSON006914 protein n=1 Tax=Culicoides sonorensis TaxID=179676 RepID=A0A336KE16_CULSO
MKYYIKYFLIQLLFNNVIVTFSLLPSSIKPCPRSDVASFDNCLSETLNKIKPNLASGNFGKGFTVPKFEPLYVAAVSIDTPELNINMTEASVTGSANFKLTSIKSDLENLQFDIGLLNPSLSIQSKYRLHHQFRSIGDAKLNIDSLAVSNDEIEKGNGTDRILLRKISNNFINSNPSFIIKQIEPSMETAFREYLSNMIMTLFEDVTLTDMFSINS